MEVRTAQVSGPVFVVGSSNYAHVERVSKTRNVVFLELYLPLEIWTGGEDKPTDFNPRWITWGVVFAFFRFQHQTLYNQRNE